MEMEFNGKMKKFQKSIMEAVETKKEEIESQVKKYKQKELEEFEDDVLSEAFVKIQSKISQLNAETEKELLEITAEYEKKILELSGEYFDKIFLEVMERLVSYTETEEYRANIIEKASKLPRCSSSTIKLASRDISLKDEIQKCYGGELKVVADDDAVLIGGFIFENGEQNIKDDQSLFTKLESQKELFYTKFGLIKENIL
ncbi:MAG: hypothetical protein RR048_02285 [Oscillospiraceae bacterium]